MGRHPKPRSLRSTEVADRLDEAMSAIDRAEARTGIRADVLLGKKRPPVVCRARGDLMLDLRRAGWGYPAIGKLFARDHGTVWTCCRTARRRQEPEARRRTA